MGAEQFLVKRLPGWCVRQRPFHKADSRTVSARLNAHTRHSDLLSVDVFLLKKRQLLPIFGALRSPNAQLVVRLLAVRC